MHRTTRKRRRCVPLGVACRQTLQRCHPGAESLLIVGKEIQDSSGCSHPEGVAVEVLRGEFGDSLDRVARALVHLQDESFAWAPVGALTRPAPKYGAFFFVESEVVVLHWL